MYFIYYSNSETINLVNEQVNISSKKENDLRMIPISTWKKKIVLLNFEHLVYSEYLKHKEE